MKIRHEIASPLATAADLWVVCAPGQADKAPEFRALDAATGGRLKAQVKAEGFSGNPGETLIAYRNGDGGHLALLGVGPGPQTPAAVRDAAAEAAKLGTRLGARSVGFAVGPGQDGAMVAYQGALGARLGLYRFDRYLSANGAKKPPQTFIIATPAPARARTKPTRQTAAVRRAEAVADAVCLARDLVNEPAGAMTPKDMAAQARKIARGAGLTATVHDRKAVEKLGMGLYLAVARGSAEEPRLIHITYKPKKKAKKVVALIGKGVTFDSGGYSLKPSASMLEMKCDMAGAAAVISTMTALAAVDCPHEVHAVCACAENMLSGDAYRLGDVLRSMDGTTVEINNTDAEGRLTLADALTYARTRIKPDEMFDFATLTGACTIALGPYTAGVMTNRDELARTWLDAARTAGEDMWPLPLIDRLTEQLKSPIADCRNTGERRGGAITAGLFLRQFVKDIPWVHVDIAGPAFMSRDVGGALGQGGTGFAVATLAEYLSR
ncbi:MAG TPA: leucyl aminopeptidase [Kofleriaceae bacterium]|nr:leucyl aminopeptidase [Kofleriaceae bacterium]